MKTVKETLPLRYWSGVFLVRAHFISDTQWMSRNKETHSELQTIIMPSVKVKMANGRNNPESL